MNAVVAISPMSSHSSAGSATAVPAVHAAIRTAANAATKTNADAKGVANSTASEPVAKPPVPVQNQDVPTAVMSAASPPPASNELATMEYVEMRSHLASGNTAAAQEAYMRLQTALELFTPSSGSVTQTRGGLNASA